LLLAKGLDIPVLVDIALVFALLAPLATTTFVRRAWYLDMEEKDGPDP
jgi:multisubunit Na+/H+ antiporter MnhF subunit